MKVFASGIMTGFPDGSFGFDKSATRAEACAILTRFLEKDQRKIPQLPAVLSNTLSVREFTAQLLKAVGKEATMEYAYEKGYVRSLAEYPSYEKPVLRLSNFGCSIKVLQPVCRRNKGNRRLRDESALLS